MLVALGLSLIVASGAVAYILMRGGLPVDRLAGASGQCVGVDDTRDVDQTGWMKPGQADFDFEIADHARSITVQTVADVIGENPATTATWVLEDVSDSTATLRLAEIEDNSLERNTEVQLSWKVDGDALRVTADSPNLGDEEPKVFETSLDDLESGDFEAAVVSGGMMSCEVD